MKLRYFKTNDTLRMIAL